MKKMILFILALALLLCACGQTERDDRDDNNESREASLFTTAPEPLAEGTVTFEIISASSTEHALVTCTGEDGAVLWTYETPESNWAMCTTLAPVGRYQNQYYFVASGALVALSMFDGSVLWSNPDFGGWPAADCAVIGEDGTVYLAGYYGPDFFMADAQGNTLMQVDQVNKDYFWPCRLTTEDGQAAIYMTGTPEGDVGTTNAVPVYVDLP